MARILDCLNFSPFFFLTTMGYIYCVETVKGLRIGLADDYKERFQDRTYYPSGSIIRILASIDNMSEVEKKLKKEVYPVIEEIVRDTCMIYRFIYDDKSTDAARRVFGKVHFG